MPLEFDTEVEIEEDFSQWYWKHRLDLIWEIILGGCWEFSGIDTVCYDPPDW